MTVRIEATIQRFNGLSTDDFPSSPPEGSTYHAVDTGERLIFFNDGWEVDLRLIKALEGVL